jgi:drug/metabolite transporter (DMT)-like permease
VLVILPASGGDTAANPIGFLFSFGSALSYAVFWHRSQRLTRALGSIRFNAVSNTVTLGCMLLFLLPALGPSDLRFSAAAAGWVAVIVVFCTVVPFFLMFEGVRRVGAAEAGLVTLFGPAVTVAAAWALLGEQLSALQLAGFGAVTLGMAALRGIANAPARLIAGFFRPRAAVKQPDEH